MEFPKKRSMRPFISGLAAALIAIVLFYAGALRFGTLAHMQAYGGWKHLFSVTPRELGYHVLSHLFLFPGAILLGFGVFRTSGGELSHKLSSWSARVNEKRFLAALALGFVAISLALRFFVLHRALLTDDEETYLLQARMLLAGKLFIAPPPDDSFFRQPFMAYANQRWFPVYPWAHPLILALGVLVKAPELIPPLLGVATMLLTYGIAKELCGKPAALGAAVLFVLSPFAEYQSATFLSESTSSALIALAVFAYLKLERGGRPRWAIASGAALGLAINCRPLTALAAGVAISIFSAAALIRERKAFFLRAWPALPAALAGLFLFLLLGRLAEGGSFVPTPFLHSSTGIVGFATLDPGVYRTTPELSLLVTSDYLMKLNVWLFGWPSSLIFVLLALAFPSASRLVALPLVVAASVLAAYFFCRFPAVDDIGPVYMFDAVPFLIVATVGAMAAIARAAASIGFERGTEVLVAVAISLFAVAAPVFHRTQAITLSSLSKTILAPLQMVEQARLRRALVFMANRNAPRPVSWVYYPPLPKPDFSDDVLYVRDLNPQADAAFAAQFPDRSAYRMRRNAEGQWQLAPLATAADEPTKAGRPQIALDPASIPLLPLAE